VQNVAGSDKSFPLDILSSADYQESEIELKMGDYLDLYTDGLLEARSPSDGLFGFDRVVALFSTRPTSSEAVESAVAFGQDDDVTVVTLTEEKAINSRGELNLEFELMETG
jgi:serine phosphatase RsbU (regulator of sigma subunit)